MRAGFTLGSALSGCASSGSRSAFFFFFSSRRRHTRWTGDWEFRRVLFRSLGYNTWLHKYIAFIIAGAFGGLSGVLWAHTAGIVSPVNVELTTSVDALLMAVLGGAGSLIGGVVGSFIVIAIREWLSTQVPWWQYVLGAVYVLTILYLPSGLMGIPERIRQWRGAP